MNSLTIQNYPFEYEVDDTSVTVQGPLYTSNGRLRAGILDKVALALREKQVPVDKYPEPLDRDVATDAIELPLSWAAAYDLVEPQIHAVVQMDERYPQVVARCKQSIRRYRLAQQVGLKADKRLLFDEIDVGRNDWTMMCEAAWNTLGKPFSHLIERIPYIFFPYNDPLASSTDVGDPVAEDIVWLAEQVAEIDRKIAELIR